MRDDTAARAWIERYRSAWETYDAVDIRALFTEDAVYRAPAVLGRTGWDIEHPNA